MIKKETVSKNNESVRTSLSEKKKECLTDWEKFRMEHGLYTAAIYDQHWVDKFKEIYGYIPELP